MKRERGRRLIVLIGFAAMSLWAPCFLLASVAAWKWMQNEQYQLASHNADIADAAATHVERYLAAVTGMLEALATSPAIDSRDFKRFDEQARSLLDLQGMHTVLRDIDGKQWVNTRLPYGSALPAGSTSITEIVSDHREPYVSDLITGPVSSNLLLVVTVPVRRDGKLVYFLGAGISPSAFTQAFKDAGIRQPNSAVIADRTGRIISRTDGRDERVGQPMIAFSDHVGEAGHWSGSSERGTAIVSSYRRAKLSGWLVAVSVDRDVLDGPLHRMVLLLGGLALLLVVAGLAVSSLIARRILRAYNMLVDAGHNLEQQDGSSSRKAKFRTSGIVEVDELGRVLANTSMRLSEQANALEKANQNLEGKVNDRTRALEESQAFLRMTLEHMNQGLVLLDQNQIVQLCNPQAHRLLDLPADVLFEGAEFKAIRSFQIDRGDFSLMSADISPKIQQSDARLFPLIYDWPRPDGRTLEVRRVQLEDGSSVNTFTDVTERRSAEVAVMESEAVYRLLAQHVSDVVICQSWTQRGCMFRRRRVRCSATMSVR